MKLRSTVVTRRGRLQLQREAIDLELKILRSLKKSLESQVKDVDVSIAEFEYLKRRLVRKHLSKF